MRIQLFRPMRSNPRGFYTVPGTSDAVVAIAICLTILFMELDLDQAGEAVRDDLSY